MGKKRPPNTRSASEERLEFTQDFIPVKDIRHGIIETTDHRFIKILEIEPINFMLRSEEEQFGIISSFASWLKISPARLQFKSITRKADSDRHINMVRQELEQEENPACKRQGEEYIRFIKEIGSREALTRRFFLIFQYEELRKGDSSDYAQVLGTMQTVEQNARAYFLQCGNTIVQPTDPDEAAAEILYQFFNRRSCVDEPFSSRVDRVVLDISGFPTCSARRRPRRTSGISASITAGRSSGKAKSCWSSERPASSVGFPHAWKEVRQHHEADIRPAAEGGGASGSGGEGDPGQGPRDQSDGDL